MNVQKKKMVKEETFNFFGNLLGSFLLALSLHVFTIPAKFAPGGVSGLASLIQIVSGFSASYSLLIFNVPLVVLSFIFLSKKFAVKTTFSILMSSLFLKIFEWVNFFQFKEQGSLILSAIAGGLISGIAIGILIRTGASSGGTDIISLLVQKKHSSLSISWFVFAMNLFVVLLGGILYRTVLKMDANSIINILLFSMVEIFMSSKAMDIILNGINSAVKFEIITSKPSEIGDAIVKRLGRGATIVETKGAYTNSTNADVICVVTRHQVSELRKLLKEIDPNAFAFAMNTREVLGNGFRKQT